MENQEAQPSPEGRNAKGQFLIGYVPNPKGNNGSQSIWQPYRKRLKRFLNMPADELIAMRDDRARIGKMSAIDVVALRQALSMLSGTTAMQERESGLNRMEGDPKNTIITDGDDAAGVDIAGTDQIIGDIIGLASARKANPPSSPNEMDNGGAPKSDNPTG